VLIQSKSLNIVRSLKALESEGAKGLLADFHKVVDYAKRQAITSYERFNDLAGIEGKETIKQVCVALMGKLKIEGDWEIYPFAVHDLIAHGRVEIDDRTIFMDIVWMRSCQGDPGRESLLPRWEKVGACPERSEWDEGENNIYVSSPPYLARGKLNLRSHRSPYEIPLRIGLSRNGIEN
jgi:hypothetical protein